MTSCSLPCLVGAERDIVGEDDVDARGRHVDAAAAQSEIACAAEVHIRGGTRDGDALPRGVRSKAQAAAERAGAPGGDITTGWARTSPARAIRKIGARAGLGDGSCVQCESECEWRTEDAVGEKVLGYHEEQSEPVGFRQAAGSGKAADIVGKLSHDSGSRVRFPAIRFQTPRRGSDRDGTSQVGS